MRFYFRYGRTRCTSKARWFPVKTSGLLTVMRTSLCLVPDTCSLRITDSLIILCLGVPQFIILSGGIRNKGVVTAILYKPAFMQHNDAVTEAA